MSARSLGLAISPDADKDSQIVNYNQVILNWRLNASRARVSLTFLSTNFRFQLFWGQALKTEKINPGKKFGKNLSKKSLRTFRKNKIRQKSGCVENRRKSFLEFLPHWNVALSYCLTDFFAK